jgi:hypothetical protein
MILTREEIAFLNVYCHEGSEVPFGGPATEVLTGIGVYNGDTLNFSGRTSAISRRPVRPSAMPARLLRRCRGPVVTPSCSATQKFGGFVRAATRPRLRFAAS